MINVLLVIAPKNFRDEELFETKTILENAGIKTTVASKTAASVVGMLGGIAKVDIALKYVNVSDYDAVVFIGGSGSAVYFNDTEVLELAKTAEQKCKIVAAICIAPVILANAGLLKGKKATVFSSEKNNLEKNSAIYTNASVEIDGKIITGNGPNAIKLFARKIVESLV